MIIARIKTRPLWLMVRARNICHSVVIRRDFVPFRRIFSCTNPCSELMAKSRDDGWRGVISVLFLPEPLSLSLL